MMRCVSGMSSNIVCVATRMEGARDKPALRSLSSIPMLVLSTIPTAPFICPPSFVQPTGQLLMIYSVQRKTSTHGDCLPLKPGTTTHTHTRRSVIRTPRITRLTSVLLSSIGDIFMPLVRTQVATNSKLYSSCLGFDVEILDELDEFLQERFHLIRTYTANNWRGGAREGSCVNGVTRLNLSCIQTVPVLAYRKHWHSLKK